jgi:leucyl aminopeptidase (aminopeptidase T)
MPAQHNSRGGEFLKMDTNRIRDLVEGCNNLIVKWGNLKRKEGVLIVTDTKVDRQLITAMESVCRLEGANVTTVIMDPPDLPHQEPPDCVSAAMTKVDLVVMCNSLLTAHNVATLKACQAGARFLGVGPSLEAMASPGARFPADIIFEMSCRVEAMWKNGKTIRVTCERGTDLTATINPAHVTEGTCGPLGTRLTEGRPRRGRIGFWEGGFGTVGTWPEWSTEGVVYFDAMQGFSGRLQTPLKVIIKKGKVEDIEGASEQVEYFHNIVRRFGPDAAHIGEIMIGLNPKADVDVGLQDRSHLYAHRAAGTMHIAFGNSIDDFITVRPGIHLDSLIIRPTVFIDNKICVNNGRLAVLDDPEIQQKINDLGMNV